MLNIVRRLLTTGIVGIGIALSATSGWAQGTQDVPVATQAQAAGQAQQPAAPVSDAAALEKARKASQNPIASMISVPFQENWNFGIGDSDRVQNVFVIQPVIPVSLGSNWNVITRWVTPIVYQL